MKKIGICRKRFVNVAMLLSMLCLCMGAMLGAKADAKAAYPDEFSMSINVTEYYDIANEVLGYINAERIRIGVEPLVIDADLQEAAMQRSAEGAFVGGHTRPNGESYNTVDPTRKLWSENYSSAYAEDGAYVIYRGWLNSSGHYQNMMNPKWKTIGLGITDRCSYIVFGCGENLKQIAISGTKSTVRTVTGLRMSQCNLAPRSASLTCVNMADGYHFSTNMEPLSLKISSKGTSVCGQDLSVFSIQSLTTDVATASSDGYITVHKSGTVTLRAVLRSNPSLSTTSTFTVKLPEKEPEEVKERVGLTVKVAKDSYVYTGKAIRPRVKVYGQDENGSLVPWIYGYSVSYRNNKAAGTAKVTVRGKGIYKELTGSATFTIRPGKVKFSSLKNSGKGKAALSWKKAPEAQGYEVQYGTQKKLKAAETERIPGMGKTGVTLKKLKSKKTYYVRIRSYKKVGGKTVYSPWSEIKKVKVK